MKPVTVWSLLDGTERSVIGQLRVLLGRIDPVPLEVLAAAAALGQCVARPRKCDRAR